MKINLRESLNELDMLSDNRYDLYNTYLSKNPSLDTKKKLSEAIYNNKSPKEIALILKEDWDDWDDSKDSEWTEMDSKSVRDSDGFLTDYTWYWRNNNGEDQHVFVFGDSDLYRPEDGYFDWECDSLEEAQEWFDSYVGPGDDDDDWMDESLKEDTSKEWKPNLNFKHIKDVLEKALSRGKYINNEREEVKAALDLCDKKQKYTPEQRKFIQDSHQEMWKKNRKTESLDEAMVKVEPTEKELNQVINVLNKYGFKVDDNYKPGRGLFGSYHIQVINPDIDYIDFDQLVKDVEPVGDALDNLSFDINMPITYNFGANDDNVITGGIDIHVGYKDDDMD